MIHIDGVRAYSQKDGLAAKLASALYRLFRFEWIWGIAYELIPATFTISNNGEMVEVSLDVWPEQAN